MNLSEVIHLIEGVAMAQPSVKQIVGNDVYRLNTLPDAHYAVFAWTQGQHTVSADGRITWNFTLFYVDRLTEDEGNRIGIQSCGIETLTNVIRQLADVLPAVDWNIQTFNARFLDECAGAFATVAFDDFYNSTCEDVFASVIPPTHAPTDSQTIQPIIFGWMHGGSFYLRKDDGIYSEPIDPSEAQAYCDKELSLLYRWDEESQTFIIIGGTASHRHDTTANWNAVRGFIPKAGEVIIYDDYRELNGTLIAGVKIGDGSAYVQDLPFTDEYINESLQAHIRNTDIHTTLAEKAFWNNKINIASNVINDTLIITRN